MNFIKKLFSKPPAYYREIGCRYMEEERYYDARNAFEEGFALLQKEPVDIAAVAGEEQLFREGIEQANMALAELNLKEAEFAITLREIDKAKDHLELAISLTNNPVLREKAEKLLSKADENINDTDKLAIKASCSSCSGSGHEEQEEADTADESLHPLEYFDLLIHQLPGDMYGRYAELGEDFAYMYVAASKNKHREALDILEKWYDGSSCRDIYCYEKGMILFRLGRIADSERFLRESVDVNPTNPMSQLGLVLLFMEIRRFDEAALHLDKMIEGEILPEQAVLFRGDVYAVQGESEQAVEMYARLLAVPALSRQAATRLHNLLIQTGRDTEADMIFKRYLKGCAGH